MDKCFGSLCISSDTATTILFVVGIVILFLLIVSLFAPTPKPKKYNPALDKMRELDKATRNHR